MFEQSPKQEIILSFDVEDNFTEQELVNPADWEIYESQVVENTQRVVNLLIETESDATFFVVGKTAERRPELVEIIGKAGFEVASHGYAHEPVDKMTEEEFEDDLRKSISILEKISKKKVKGYRARSFSINRKTLWAFPLMKKYGLSYDSSLTQTEYDILTETITNFPMILDGIDEIPVCNKMVFGKSISLSGGIALRLLCLPLYRYLLEHCKPKTGNRIIYAHVWEFNKDQPDRKVGRLQRIAQSPYTYSTGSKIRNLSVGHAFVSFEKHLKYGFLV